MNESQNTDIETAIWQEEDTEPIETTEEQGPDLADRVVSLLETYWRRRKLACGIVAAGIVLSVAYSLTLKNYYRSTTTLMPPDDSSPYSSMLGMLSGASTSESLGSTAFGLSTPGDLQVSILESRTVEDAMIKKFDLMSYYGVRNIERARTALKADTSVDQDRKSGVITIAVTNDNPQNACKLADGYVAELNRVLTDGSTSAARRERQFLEGRLIEVKQELDESAKVLSQFSTKNMALDIPAQSRSVVESGLRLQTMISEGQSQLAALRETYSEDNYRIKAIKARIAELQRQAISLTGIEASNASHAKADSPYPNAGELPKLGVTFADLERKMRVDEVLWESLTKQYEMARVQEAKEVPTVHVLDPAIVPGLKAGPHRSIIVITVTLLSFVLSCIVIFGQATWEGMAEDSLLKKLVARLFKKRAQSTN